MEQLWAAAQVAASMVLAVGSLAGIGIGGAWLMTRGQPCNPYGHDACACGCGTNCEEGIGG